VQGDFRESHRWAKHHSVACGVALVYFVFLSEFSCERRPPLPPATHSSNGCRDPSTESVTEAVPDQQTLGTQAAPVAANALATFTLQANAQSEMVFSELPSQLQFCVERQGDHPVLHVEWLNQTPDRWLLVIVQDRGQYRNPRLTRWREGELSGEVFGLRFPDGSRSIELPLARRLCFDSSSGTQYFISVSSVRSVLFQVAKQAASGTGWGASPHSLIAAEMSFSSKEIPEFRVIRLKSEERFAEPAIPGAMVLDVPQGTFSIVTSIWADDIPNEQFDAIPQFED
jgi:hypothetical protein